MKKIRLEKTSLNYSDEELLREIEKEVFSCPKATKYLKSIGLDEEQIKANAIKIFDFVSDVKYCDNCPGYNQCQKENRHLVTKIIVKNGEVDRQLQPCPKIIAKIEFDTKFVVNDVDETLIAEEKENYFSDDKQNDLVKASLLFKKLASQKEYNWYYFCYKDIVQSIKNAYKIALNMIKEDNYNIAYLKFPMRVNELVDLAFTKKAASKEEFNKKIELYSNVPVLVLEGFGDEFANDFIRDSIINVIINNRSTKRLPTLFVSRYHISELVSLYSSSNAGAIRAKQMIKQIKMLCEEEFTDDLD